MRNLNGLHKKADELLAAARDQALADNELALAQRWWDEFCARVMADIEAFLERCPEALQDDVIDHLNPQIREFNKSGDVAGAGLLAWFNQRQRNPVGDHQPIPWPDGELPEWMVRAYLEDGAGAWLECADCGHGQPGIVHRAGGFAEPVQKECWACGGPVGLLAWFHALHAAVQKMGAREWEVGPPLAWLVEQGYQLGHSLSEWLAERESEHGPEG